MINKVLVIGHITFRFDTKKTSVLALGSQYKSNGTVTLSSKTENNHKKVTSIGSLRNMCHSTQKGRFKLCCLIILNSFCLILLTFLLIHMMKVSFEHQTILTNYTSLKICCRKRLWSPLFLFAQQQPRVKCKANESKF